MTQDLISTSNLPHDHTCLTEPFATQWGQWFRKLNWRYRRWICGRDKSKTLNFLESSSPSLSVIVTLQFFIQHVCKWSWQSDNVTKYIYKKYQHDVVQFTHSMWAKWDWPVIDVVLRKLSIIIVFDVVENVSNLIPINKLSYLRANRRSPRRGIAALCSGRGICNVI